MTNTPGLYGSSFRLIYPYATTAMTMLILVFALAVSSANAKTGSYFRTLHGAVKHCFGESGVSVNI